MKFFLPFVFLFFLATPIQEKTAYAENDMTEFDSVDETVDSFMENMDLEAYQEYFDRLTRQYGFSSSENIKQIVHGLIYQETEINEEFFLKILTSFFLGNVGTLAAEMGVVFLICILLSLLSNLSSGFSSGSTEKIVYLACYGVIVAIVLSITSSTVGETIKLIELMATFSETIFPPLLTAMTALGSVSATGLYQPILAFLSVTIISAIQTIIMPLFYLCFLLTVIGHINEDLKLEKLTKTIRSAGEWILGLFFGVFSAVTTSKGIAGSGLDSFAVRSAKYTLSGYVPIVGNYLKDGFDIVTAALSVVKNAVGVTAVFLLLLTVLFPLIKLLTTMLIFRLTASLAEPFGEKRVSSMLYELSDCFKLPVILILCMAFCFLILLMLIILSCNRGIA